MSQGAVSTQHKEQGEWLSLARPYAPAVVKFVQDLVRIPSVNGRDSEAAVARRIAEEASALGFNPRMMAKTPGRPNVLITWGQGNAGFALIGHMDTVAEGDATMWTTPPFAADIHKGRMIGRGTADNKAGIACGLYAMALLRDHHQLEPDAAHITLAGVVDEESGASSPLGVRYLLDTGRLQGLGAIYTYASDIICVGHRGLLRVKLHVIGKAVHSGSPEWSQGRGGINAVTGLAEILLALEAQDLPAPSHPAFANLNCTLTPGTLIQGGEYESMVPAHAEAMVDIRLMPGQSSKQVVDMIQTTIDTIVAHRPGLKVKMEIKNNLPGAAIPMDHPLVKIAERHTQTITGHTWPVAGAGPANEGYMLIEAGIPTLCGFGPTGGNAHAPDEWIDIASLPQTVAMYAGIMRDYLIEN